MKKLLIFIMPIITLLVFQSFTAGQKNKHETWQFLDSLKKLKNKSFENLISIDEEKADSIFIKFYRETQLLIRGNLSKEIVDLIRCCGGVRGGGFMRMSVLTSKQIELYSLLVQNGLHIKYVGEGCAEIMFQPDYYYRIFKKYVSNGLAELLKIKMDEDNGLYVTNSGVVLPIENLGECIIRLEVSMQKCPESKYKNIIRGLRNRYLRDFMQGYDCQPVFYEGKIEDGMIAMYENFIEFNPKMPATKVIREYLDMIIKNNGNYNSAYEKLIPDEGEILYEIMPFCE